MKKILIATNVLFLGIVLFLGYKLYIPKTGIDTNQIGDGKKPCASKFCKDYSEYPWYGRITGYEADLLANKYREDIGKKFIWNGELRTNKDDSRSAWFSLETIKKYIWEIETKNCDHKCSDSLGIRIYYARYPKRSDPIWSELGSESMLKYADHHTLFMVPTFWDKITNTHWDFDPWGLKCHARISKDSIPSIASGAVLLIGGGTDAQNHGSLIPPDDPAGTGFGGGF